MALPYSNVLVRYRGFKRFRGRSQRHFVRAVGAYVVVVVREVVEVTLLVVALLPRGGVLSVGVLDLLAIDLVVMEPALLTVHRW